MILELDLDFAHISIIVPERCKILQTKDLKKKKKEENLIDTSLRFQDNYISMKHNNVPYLLDSIYTLPCIFYYHT